MATNNVPVLLDTLAELGILKTVEGLELIKRYALYVRSFTGKRKNLLGHQESG